MFVLTLGYSRKAVRLLTFQSSTRVRAELPEQAFRRLGGATRTVVLDNLREGILKPDIYDPALNPLYRDMLAHYGAIALPCRVHDPDRKGKVERSVGHAKNTPLKGVTNPELMLQAHNVDIADAVIIGRAQTRRQFLLLNIKPHRRRIVLPAMDFAHRVAKTLAVRMRGRYRHQNVGVSCIEANFVRQYLRADVPPANAILRTSGVSFTSPVRRGR
ncbi:MAG: transposase family protein [Bryobacterales bacterium]|nr:transposase family protein [Bryobacterales bacterium]